MSAAFTPVFIRLSFAMPTSEAFVDWIACTFIRPGYALGDAINLIAPLIGVSPSGWQDAKPQHGYKSAARALGGAQVMVGRKEMGAHLIVPGSALAGAGEGRLSVPQLISSLFAHGARFARLDLAIDAVNTGLVIPALKHAFDAGLVEKSARKCALILTGRDGYCLYVGSRTSARFLRIYNKAAEVTGRGIAPDAGDWVRIELETKGYFANSAAHRIAADRAVARTAAAYIRSCIDFPFNIAWRAAVNDVHEAIPRSSRRLTNTRAWLLNICAAALARQLMAEPGFQEEFERSVQSAMVAGLDKTRNET